MPSVDIVSEIDTAEILNATDNANRELSTRFDFRGVDASIDLANDCLLYTSPSPRDGLLSRMPSSA